MMYSLSGRRIAATTALVRKSQVLRWPGSASLIAAIDRLRCRCEARFQEYLQGFLGRFLFHVSCTNRSDVLTLIMELMRAASASHAMQFERRYISTKRR